MSGGHQFSIWRLAGWSSTAAHTFCRQDPFVQARALVGRVRKQQVVILERLGVNERLDPAILVIRLRQRDVVKLSESTIDDGVLDPAREELPASILLSQCSSTSATA